jgi:hypothetical protein
MYMAEKTDMNYDRKHEEDCSILNELFLGPAGFFFAFTRCN